MRSPNIFTDPAGVVPQYDWHINHSQDGEQEWGGSREISHTATTSGVGVVRQQGADAPLKIVVDGTVLQSAQHEAFIAWYQLCRDQTIYFTDFAGDEYEVIVTAYKPRREGVVKNPRGGTDAPNHIWRYRLEMDVVNVISGAWS